MNNKIADSLCIGIFLNRNVFLLEEQSLRGKFHKSSIVLMFEHIFESTNVGTS